MRSDFVKIPSFNSSVGQVWRRNYLQFKKSWLVNFFWIVIEPIFVLLALGYGLGSFVGNIGGVTYADFFFPALLCSSSMMVSFFESTYGNYSKLSYQKLYKTMILTPIDPQEIVIGELLWGATKGTFSAIGVTLVAAVFGHVSTVLILPALVIIFISSFLFSALGMLVTSWTRNYDGIVYPTSGLIIPMSLFSGTYFPLDHLPLAVKFLAYIFPLTHTVSAVRTLLVEKTVTPVVAINVIVLIIGGLIIAKLASHRIQKKLIN